MSIFAKSVSKSPLTADEVALLGRASNFIVAALKRHGITLNGSEVAWVGAEVADFVNAETQALADAITEAEQASNTTETPSGQ